MNKGIIFVQKMLSYPLSNLAKNISDKDNWMGLQRKKNI